MRLILMGRHRPSGCTCVEVHDNPNNLDEITGISVAHSCLMHGNKLQGYMWHPAHACGCVVIQHKNGRTVTNTRNCPRHNKPDRNFPVEKTVMK